MGSQIICNLMKILILTMCHQTNDENFDVFKKIWLDKIEILKNKNYSIDVKFLYCSEFDETTQNYIVNVDNLLSNCSEDYWTSLLKKVMNGFEYFINTDYDLVFKTNLSTIINFDLFYELCQKIFSEESYIYEGIIGEYENYSFCSGAGMLLNRKSVELILKNKNQIDDKWTDDIFIGFILNLNGVRPTNNFLNRFDILKSSTNVNESEIKKYSHIRIKIRQGLIDSEMSKKVFNFLYV